MGIWAVIKNGLSVPRKDIPIVSMAALAAGIAAHVKDGLRPVQFFGHPARDSKKYEVLAVLADDTSNTLMAASALTEPGRPYDSITPSAASLHLFERELYEQTGIIPSGHPWLKPVRCTKPDTTAYEFYGSLGKDTHEVAVGPVHAGIIEPGHFRFICHGEEVYHLEIRLGYQHRGIEALFKEGNPMFKTPLAESIAGDSAVAHAWAHVRALEALCGAEPSQKAEILRATALELERIAMHIAGLAGVSADIGFLPGASAYGRVRTAVVNTTLMLTGCRFGRGYIRPGGVLSDVSAELRQHILTVVDETERDLDIVNACLFNSPGVLSRLEHTGRISTDMAWRVGLVGTMAKSAGLPIDIRADQPYGIYKKDRFYPVTLNSGDVYARMKVKALEITQSIELIRRWLNFGIMTGEIYTAPSLIGPGRFVVTLVEGWRGEVSHAVITGGNSEIEHYKIVDASFHNWAGLALAVRRGGISDFPVCNKSFDASYAGHDL